MIHSTIKIRLSPLFGSAENSDIRKYYVVCFPMIKPVDTPLIVIIPPHVLMMLVHKLLKWKPSFQRTDIVA